MKKQLKFKKIVILTALFALLPIATVIISPQIVDAQPEPTGGTVEGNNPGQGGSQGETLPGDTGGSLPTGQTVEGNNPGQGGSGGSVFTIKNPINAGSFPELIKKLFDAIIQIGFVVVVLAIIYSGFLFVMASGNPEKLKTAKTTLMYTLIGGAVLLGAEVISQIICNTAAQFNATLRC